MRILARRYRAAHGEIDLIALDGDTCVFVEVKARSRGALGDGLRAINSDKRAHLQYAARQYLAAHPYGDIRFDAVEITVAGVRHIKHAF